MNWILIETAKNGIVNGALIALLAISFSWVYRTTRVFHIALAAQVLAGGYAAVFVSQKVTSFPLSLIAAAVSAGVISMILMTLHMQLQRRETSNSLRLVASVGAYFLAAGLASVCFGNDIKRGALNINASWQLGHIIVTSTDVQYVSMLFITTILLLAFLRLPIGNGIAALGSNRKLYSVLGHDDRWVYLLVHLISGTLAGLCGGFEALRNGIEPFGYLPLVISGAVAALMGGRSLIVKPVTVGLIIGLLKSFTTQIVGDKWVDTSIYGILLIMVCVWPRLVLAPSIEEERP